MTNRRFTKGDIAFFAAFGVYAGAAVAVLLLGVGAAVASSDHAWHAKLELWALASSLRGRVAAGMLNASTHTQPGYQLALDYLFSVFNLALAGFLLWLRPRDATARRLAVAVVGTAAVFNLQAHGVYESMNVTHVESFLHSAFQLIAAIAYIDALLRFPDGRLVPRWPRWALAALYGPLSAVIAFLAFTVKSNTTRTITLILYFGLLTPITGVLSQAYRYRRSPTPVERQQSRLVFWALLPALLVSLFALTRGIQSSAFSNFQNRPIDVIPVALFRVFQPVFALIPVALFVGILRYRLWNIDRVISRTLLYGILAGFVSAVYVAVVVGIGRAIGEQGGHTNLGLSILATGIVALGFQPVKERVNKLANRLVYGKRATPYEVLSALGERMSTTVATEELLPLLARMVAEGTGASRADVWLVRGEQAWLATSWPQDDSAREGLAVEGSQFPIVAGASAVVPVRHDEELLGALTVTKPGSEQLSPTEDKLLHDVGAQAGLVMRNVRLTAELLDRLEELRASRQRLVAAQDAERRRLERNLHDGAQQQLVALKVQLGLAERMAEGGQSVAELLRQLKDDTGEALENLRDLARGIYPPLLAAEGLPAAVAAHARKASVEVDIDAEGVGRYPQDVETAVYFCVLEALQNASKYAGGSKVSVALAHEGAALVFRVGDEGQGFDPVNTPKGAGTQNMADRVAALDGTLTITSSPGHGTTVTGRIPTHNLNGDVQADGAGEPAAEPAAGA